MRISISSLFAITAFILATSTVSANDSWPQWRGPSQNGVGGNEPYPSEWDEEAGIAWKTELPGLGGSTPVIAGGTAYLTAGVDGKNHLLAIDTDSGKVKWQSDLGKDRGGKHRKGSGSNPSAVVDGDSVFAYFRSGDLACVDTKGNVRWQINLQEKYGEDTLWWDLGSSPTVTDDAVIVAVMQTGPSYLVALDKKSGEPLWKTDRMLDAPEEAAQSYATPLAVTVDGRPMIAVMGADHLTIHDAKNGKELGRLGGFNPNGERFWRSISSPVASGNLIVCPYARGDTVTAVRMDHLVAGKGDKSIAWMRDGLGSDVPTPAIHDDKLYIVGDKAKGLVSCVDLQTGKTLWKAQLPKSRTGFSSSPLVAGNHLYVTAEDAKTFVIGPLDGEAKVVATNELADSDPFTVASPVPVQDDLLLRSRHRLYRVAGK